MVGIGGRVLDEKAVHLVDEEVDMGVDHALQERAFESGADFFALDEREVEVFAAFGVVGVVCLAVGPAEPAAVDVASAPHVVVGDVKVGVQDAAAYGEREVVYGGGVAQQVVFHAPAQGERGRESAAVAGCELGRVYHCCLEVGEVAAGVVVGGADAEVDVAGAVVHAG